MVALCASTTRLPKNHISPPLANIWVTRTVPASPEVTTRATRRRTGAVAGAGLDLDRCRGPDLGRGRSPDPGPGQGPERDPGVAIGERGTTAKMLLILSNISRLLPLLFSMNFCGQQRNFICIIRNFDG